MVEKHKLEKPQNSLPIPAQLKPYALRTHEEVSTPLTMTRRSMLKNSAAWLTMAYGLAACDRVPPRKIVSRPNLPEYQTPGEAVYYASTWTDGNYPYPMLVKTVDGRPIKIDGNPDVAINFGKSTSSMQASTLSLYDPDRLRHPLKDGKKVSWEDADKDIIGKLKEAKSVVLVTRSNIGPSERDLVKRFQDIQPKLRHLVYEAIHDGLRQGTWEEVFEQEGESLPKFSQADIILSLESDFLGTDGIVPENVREFITKRKISDKNPTMSRLYMVESTMSVTGSNADTRFRLRSSQMLSFTKALLASLRGEGKELSEYAKKHNLSETNLSSLVSDLNSHKEKSLVVAGPHHSKAVQATVALINQELGAFGKTLAWNSKPATLSANSQEEIEQAFSEEVDVFICMGTNPVYSWAGNDFSNLLKKAKLTIAHGLYIDETMSACTYALPSHHNLESWNDAAPRDGLYTFCQPTISKLHDTRQEAESLLVWARGISKDSKGLDYRSNDTENLWYSYIRYYANKDKKERQWIKSLEKGVIGEIVTTEFPKLNADKANKLGEASVASGEYELLVTPHHSLYDGRFANNPWLQELPDPTTKLVWDNAAMLSHTTAKKLGVEMNDLIDIQAGKATIQLPVLPVKGIADNVIVATLGHGREKAGTIGSKQGHSISALKGTPDSPWHFPDVKVKKNGEKYTLVRTQKYFSMEDRPLALDTTLSKFKKDSEVFHHKQHKPSYSQLHDHYDYSINATPYKWAMAIDLNSCIGCNTCMLACQVENNISFVGKEECSNGREMHWIRIDRYEGGDEDNPTIHHQPMLCQHCDNAPCESVCPVQATAHSPDGLNEMVYNRCVGTRYCANNCPYKVRRFNYYDYRDLRDSVQELAFNPQVTVRSRGVMEKCTFCVQRINSAKFEAKNDGKEVADGAIQTACQEVCPSQAIHFGNINDPNSHVAQIAKSSRAYKVLEEINVRPSISYLGKVRNPSENV